MSLDRQPRARLATLPTPLQEAPRLRQALGGARRCPRRLLKRDDLTGLAFGGNKVRKLEFLLADALGAQATCLVTAGALQSNHARATAAAARSAGLRAALVLTSADPDPPLQGNYLLDRLLGAETRLVAEDANLDLEMERVAAELTARGERPYLIPVGGSNARGALGYVAATSEIVEQFAAMGDAAGILFYASGSRGTQAGLALGSALYHAPYRLQGIAVSAGEAEKKVRASRIAAEAARLLGTTVIPRAHDLDTDQRYIGPGYGVPSDGCLEAIGLLARHEAVFLDPVYSGKAMAGLIDHIRQGLVDPRETVIFLHTGGAPALFARPERLAAALQD